ncbi:glycosyltransferase [uncultured Tateyamaria sp.]|uniref:glycosyltransferase n=1 Tax=Tateyamaria sp. 1078 TaxID=3417464 RepID=UPI0026288BB6|nr:glycosyltransferase [uncultured Tateyamaria sp.]
MRVLFVNWVDYLDAEGRGGGVSLYQRNLMAARPGDDTVFLASGTSYDLRPGPPRWEQMRHGPDRDRARRFEIVNSGVMAPAHVSFGDPAQVTHPATEAVFFDFVARQGPFDVVHFNNLEGLPAGVLRLGDRFPGTRVVMSLHNYYPFCPQVNLWRQERAHCTDFEGGAACETCLTVRPAPRSVRLAGGLSYRLKCAGLEPGTRVYDGVFRVVMGLGRRGLALLRALRPSPAQAPPVSQAGAYAARRSAMVGAMNAGCDVVLCVSDAVRDIALSYGLEPDLARTCYIGTAQAEIWAQSAPRPLPPGPLRIAYLGYMRRDKGFFFLLDALEAAPDALLGQLHLVVAARRGEEAAMTRLEALRPRLAALDWHDGYTHAGLDGLLGDVDVGLVPPLWADNLPQVAIEMHSRHIPLLCSDRGGAQELAGCDAMVFAAGDGAAFRARLAALVAGEIDMDAYWRCARAPVTMAQHVAELERHYHP